MVAQGARRLLGEDGDGTRAVMGADFEVLDVVAVLEESLWCVALGGVLRIRTGGGPLGWRGG
jgi:hypothetical protein